MTPAKSGEAQSSGVLRWIEIGVVVICLVLFSEGLVQRLVTGEEDVDGNIILRIMWLPVYGVVAALALSQARAMFALAVRMPLLVLLVLMAAASFAWSIDPALSLRRGISVAMTSVFAMYLVARFDWAGLLRLLGGVWAAMTLLSFGAGLVAPEFARVQEIHVGSWRGFWFEKNTLGGHMARASLIFAFLIVIDRGWQRGLWIGAYVLSVMLVLLSTSATALLGVAIGSGVMIGGLIMQGSRLRAIVLAWLGTTLIAGLAAAIVFAPDAVFGLIGKDATLTGRTDIWQQVVHSISQRPLLGYGYGAFWAVDSQPAFWIREALDWDAPTAHNGWLDVSLSVGLLGAAIFALGFAITMARAVGQFLDHQFGLFAVGLLAQFGLFSMSESIVLEQNSLVWISYVAVVGYLARGVSREGRVQRRAPSGKSGLRLKLDASGVF